MSPERPARFTLVHESPVGPITLVATGEALEAALFDGASPPDARPGPTPLLDAARAQLDAYFAGTRRRFDLPLAAAGSPFQREVWAALCRIPWGETRSYGDVARELGKPDAVRAVGAANGRNPIAIIVPCHRVIGAGGALTGYAGGLERKRWLLSHEQGQVELALGPARARSAT